MILREGNILIEAQPARRASQRWAELADRWRYLLFAVLALAYLAGFNGQWRIEPDSALYLALGRSLAEGKGYAYLGQPHHLAYPGLPFLFALLFKCFGGHVFLAADLMMLAFAAGGLVLTYRLFETHAGRPTAVVVTLGVGITHTFYQHAFLLLTDMPFLVGILGFLAGYERLLSQRVKWIDWALLAAGLGLLVVMRPTMWAFLPVAAVSVGWSMATGKIRQGRWMALGLVLLAGGVFWAADPRRSGGGPAMGQYEDAVLNSFTIHLGGHLQEIWHKNLPELFGPITTVAAFGVEMWPPEIANPIMGAIVVLAGVLLVRRRMIWGLWVAALVALMLLVLPVRRYYLAAIPLIVYAWWLTIVWVNSKLPGRWGDWAFAFLLILGTVPNMLKMGEFMLEQQRRPYLETYRNGKYAYVHPMSEAIARNVGDDAWVVSSAKTGRVMSFLSRKRVIEAREVEKHGLLGKQLYLVVPGDEAMRQWLTQANIAIGEEVARVGRKDSPWRLCRAKMER